MIQKFLTTSVLLLALSGCGVPSNPEKGPVVLLCEGEHYLRAGNGTVERQKITQFYKVDGLERSLYNWDSEQQRWMGSTARITITPNEISLQEHPHVMGGISSIKTTSFDRAAGRVHEDFTMSNGGVITFDGVCKPVVSPTDEKKF